MGGRKNKNGKKDPSSQGSPTKFGQMKDVPMSEEDRIVADTASALHLDATEGLRAEMDRVRNTDLRDSQRMEKRINPFTYDDHWDAWEVFKVCLGIVVVPIRFLLFFIFLALWAFFSWITTSKLFGYDPTKPMGCIRRLILFPGIICCRLILFFTFGVYWIHKKGKLCKSSEARICVIAPHSTILDSFVVSYMLGMPSAVAKKEVSKTLFIGSIAVATQSILVDRKSKTAKADVLEQIKTRAETPGFRHLVIFPEGTCTNRKSLISFKRGAFSPGKPIQPILLRWPFVNFNPAWTAGGPSRNVLLMRLMCQFKNSVEIEFLPVYHPSEDEISDPGLYGENVRQMMAGELGIGTTDHSYEDMFLANTARKNKINPEEAMPFEFKEIRRLYNISLDEATTLLKRYTELRNKRRNQSVVGRKGKGATTISEDGGLSLDEFAELLGIPINEAVIELFSLLDVQGAGSIDFPTFLIGMAFISKSTTTEEAADLVFRALDRKEEGKIPIRRLQKVLESIFARVDQSKIAPMIREADPDRTGFVTKEAFIQVLRKHPEYLHLGLKITALENKDRQLRPMSVNTGKLSALDRKRLGKLDKPATSGFAGIGEEDEELGSKTTIPDVPGTGTGTRVSVAVEKELGITAPVEPETDGTEKEEV